MSCPPEWKKRDELCFLYKGGSLTYEEAKEYCEVIISKKHFSYIKQFIMCDMYMYQRIRPGVIKIFSFRIMEHIS